MDHGEKMISDMGLSSPSLTAWLAELNPYLQEEDLIECSVIKAGELNLEISGKGYKKISTPKLDLKYWETLCHVLANHWGLAFDPIIQPRLSVMLPGGHRFEAMLGSNVESKLSISIRMRRYLKLSFEDYGLNLEHEQMIISLIKEGANILISGGTSSGKTTFMNCLLSSIPQDKRILVLEDTRELTIPHENHVHYVVSRNEKNPTLDYPQMIDHLMRSRPDIILMGELSMANSYPILRLLNSGHAGFMCTLHANSCESALSWAIPQNIAFSGHEPKGVKEFLYEAVDLVIQLHRSDKGQRYVGEMMFPKTQELIRIQP
ncbi:hypothetical protein IM40_11195 (plasmid) [Candidatus Paracaedimonas acanthamoebae]|nr:hypothetical protein IM40_09275 [Candidatus Paracaedimonas acanthamoebae]AIL13896.1 hypothetical protein IM40_11195 [Candidatus Paracaedimonas acanthamoebae]